VPLEQLHHNINELTLSEGSVVLCYIWVVEVLQDGNFFADLCDYKFIDCFVSFVLIEFFVLFWSYIEIRKRDFLHRVAVLTSFDRIDRTISPFAQQFIHRVASNFLLISLYEFILGHLLKIDGDLFKLLEREFLVELLEQGDVGVELPCVVADIDELAEYFRREDQFEGFLVLVEGVEHAQQDEAVELYFVLHFYVFLRVLAIVGGLLFDEGGAVAHEDLADGVRAVDSDKLVILVVRA